MPAYFGVSIEFDRQNITQCFVHDFYEAMAKHGATFDKGYYKADGLTYNEIVKLNQKYLSGDLKDGYMYQVLFNFGDYSEVRGYWDNDEGVVFSIIIPEDDFISWNENNKGYDRLNNRMSCVKNLAISLWKDFNALAIQTSWECSDIPPTYKDILKEKVQPQAEPFSIIPKTAYLPKWNIDNAEIANEGLLLENNKNWLYL